MKKKKGILCVCLLLGIFIYCIVRPWKSNYASDISSEDSLDNLFEYRNSGELEDSSDSAVNEDWRLLLVNSTHKIPADYDVELTKLSNGVCVDSRIYPDLQQMFDDAREEGVNPVVGEGYRTYGAQQQMMQDKINAYIVEGYSERKAEDMAKEWVAEPGTSEHELGIAVDINAGDNSTSEEVYEWLADSAYKYGFILRYPLGKEHITGIDYEPWHYRYVGREAALEIYQKKITLEEYLGWE